METKPDSGNEKTATMENPGGGGISRNLGEARAKAAARAQARDKGRGDDPARKGDRPGTVPAPAVRPQPYTAESVSGILALPFHALALALDDERFVLDETEKKTLADSGALVANAYMPVDPKTSALTLFAGALIAITLTKVGIYAELRRSRIQQAQEEANKNAGHHSPRISTEGNPPLSAV